MDEQTDCTNVSKRRGIKDHGTSSKSKKQSSCSEEFVKKRAFRIPSSKRTMLKRTELATVVVVKQIDAYKERKKERERNKLLKRQHRVVERSEIPTSRHKSEVNISASAGTNLFEQVGGDVDYSDVYSQDYRISLYHSSPTPRCCTTHFHTPLPTTSSSTPFVDPDDSNIIDIELIGTNSLHSIQHLESLSRVYLTQSPSTESSSSTPSTSASRGENSSTSFVEDDDPCYEYQSSTIIGAEMVPPQLPSPITNSGGRFSPLPHSDSFAIRSTDVYYNHSSTNNFSPPIAIYETPTPKNEQLEIVVDNQTSMCNHTDYCCDQQFSGTEFSKQLAQNKSLRGNVNELCFSALEIVEMVFLLIDENMTTLSGTGEEEIVSVLSGRAKIPSISSSSYTSMRQLIEEGKCDKVVFFSRKLNEKINITDPDRHVIGLLNAAATKGQQKTNSSHSCTTSKTTIDMMHVNRGDDEFYVTKRKTLSTKYHPGCDDVMTMTTTDTTANNETLSCQVPIIPLNLPAKIDHQLASRYSSRMVPLNESHISLSLKMVFNSSGVNGFNLDIFHNCVRLNNLAELKNGRGSGVCSTMQNEFTFLGTLEYNKFLSEIRIVTDM